ncbi:hypothetical protein ACQP2F_02955 [Actinoplanes sp. CA-030573]|uniref:hypothetical protein n=1 Tax=Actinoplanes sp. CA-030573 TaxID=3239898 RepID=UPI003D909056
MLTLPPESVDVADDGDADRDWEAPVNCTVAPLNGDLNWHLDIYVSAVVSAPPPEPAAASWLATRLRVTVAYEAHLTRPSAFWLVGPDGKRTRARIYEEDSDDIPAYRIDAAEHPIASLPGLRVAAIPEVIRDYRMPTPITDRFRESSSPAVKLLGAWESSVTRLIEGWPPDGWYPAEYYREDLETRDSLDPAPEELASALTEIDRRFADATIDDGGRALAAATGPLPRAAHKWWWHRIPQALPWQNAPGRG